MKTTLPFLISTLAAVALVACGDDGSTSGGGSGDGGSDQGGGSPSSPSASSSSVTAGNSTASGAATSTSSSAGSGGEGPGSGGQGPGGQGPGSGGEGPGSGGEGPGSGSGGEASGSGGAFPFTECDEPVFLFGDDLDECANADCCDQITLCAADLSACFDDDGNLDQSLAGGADFYQCLYLAECFGGAVVCDSGLTFGTNPSQETLELAYCIDQSCCEEMTFCTSGASDTQSCIDCLNGEVDEFDLCQGVSDCADELCDAPLVFVPYCDSGIGTSAGALGLCGSELCCEDYVECTGGTNLNGDPLDEDQLLECLACLNDDGVGLCEDVVACMDENCNTGVCDSGLSYNDPDLAACLTSSCCAVYNQCTSDGADVDACVECLQDEDGGALCDDVIDCYDTNCAD